MANINKGLVITPNIGASTNNPNIVFSGADANTTAQNITLTAYPTNNGTLSFDGSAGQLFSITNSLTGTLFSFNDVSGIPSIEVLDTGVVKLAQYSGSVGIGTASPVNKLDVTGSIGVTSQLISTIATGTAPFVIASTTPVANLSIGGNAATSTLAASATILATARAIYGNNFDGSAALAQVIASTYGGTGNGFTKFTGPTTSEKIFTLPDASSTLLYSGGALGTPSSGTLTNCTGTASGLTAGNVTTNANLTGEVTSVGNAATLTNSAVIAKVLTGFTSGSGTVSASDSILSAIQKVDGNTAANLVTAKAYADGLVVGLWDDRGSFNASVNTFPTTGGSGTAGAILKGDIWTISVIATSGPLLGYLVGTNLRAIIDAPGQTVGNWAIIEVGLGYTPANTANGLNQFAATTSAQLAGIISDKTGSGALAFATNTVLVTPQLGTPQSGNFSTGTFTWPTFNQSTSGNAGTATILATARNIYGNSFNGSVDVTNVIAATYGGTGNAYTQFTGPTTSIKTFTLPDASSTLLYSGGALGTPSSGTLTNCTFPTLNQNTTGSANSLLSPSTTGIVKITGMTAGTTRTKTVRDADDTLLELGGSYTPSGTWIWTSAAVTWPTFNQSTTGSAATLTTSRSIHGGSFNGSADVTNVIAAAYGGTGNAYTTFTGPTTARSYALPDASVTLLYSGGALGTPSSGTLTNCTFPTLNQSTTGSAATLTTARSIYGNNFDGSVALAQVIAATYGGTGNAYTQFTGPTTSIKTFTLPDASSTLLYSGGALGTPSSGTLTNCTFPTLNQSTTGSAATLTTSRSIHGGSFNGSADVTNVIAATYGGTGNAYTTFTGPTTARSYALPDASVTLLYSGGALGTPSGGTLTNCTFPTLNQNTTGSANSLKSPSTTGLVTIGGMTAGTTRAKTVRDADDTLLELGGSYTPTGTWIWTSAAVTWPTFNQSTTGSAATLTTSRNIYGNSFNGSADLTQVIAATYGGTGNAYTTFTGPTTARSYALPDASVTLLYSGGALGTPSSGTLTNCTIPSLSGEVSNISNAITLSNSAVIAKVLTGFTSGSGTVSASDSILSAIQKVDGNTAANLITAKAYADGLVVGLWDDRGSYNASTTNAYPAVGGSGTAGAVLKGDVWTVSVVAASGPLLGYVIGTVIRALTDAPGQTGANWAVTEVGFGYTPANIAGNLSQFASTTSAQLLSIISDKTGSGSLVFATNATLVTPILGIPTSGTLTNCDGTATNLTAGKATILATARAIYGNNFDGSAALAQVIASTYGGTGNGFTTFTGPTTAEKTFTLPDASATLLYSGGALGTPSSGTLTNCTFPTLNQSTSGNAGTATILATARNIYGNSFNGSADLTQVIAATYGGTGNAYTTFTGPTSARSYALPDSSVTLLYSGGALGTPSSGTLTNCTFPTLNQSTTGSAATLTTARAIYGNNFDGSAALAQVIASTYGGTGNAFTQFTGPTTSIKTFTLPDASATLLYSGGALGTPSSGTLTNCTFPTLNQNTTGSANSLLSPSTTGIVKITGMTAASTRTKTVRDADDTLLELGGSYTPSGTWVWTSAAVTWPTFNQSTSGNAGTATILATARNIYGNSFNGSADLTQVIAATYGGTGNAYTTFTGPTAARSYALPDSSVTLLYSGGALGTPSGGTLTNCTFPTLNQNTTGSANSLKSPSTTGLVTLGGMTAGVTRAKTVRDADDTLLELGGSYTPSGTWIWTSATVTWPTFNQSTSGTAAGLSATLAIGSGGTNNTTYTAPAGNILPILYYDGTRLNTDSTLTDLGYNTVTNTVMVNNLTAAGNVKYNNVILGYQAIATAGTTTTLTVTSPNYINFTGSSNQTCKLPNATTLSVGYQFEIDNSSTGILSVTDGNNGVLWTIPPNGEVYLTCTSIGSVAGTWNVDYVGAYVASGKMLTVSNSITLAGTDATTMTFPTTSATVLTSANLVTVAQGGTGLGTLTANNVILGNGTSTPSFVAPGTSGNVLTSNGTTWVSLAPGASGATITDDLITNQNQYIGMSRANSGAWTTAYTASTEFYYNPFTGICSSGGFNSLSDINLKIEVTTVTNAVALLEQINGVRFKWKNNGESSVGLIAQEVEQILPELVSVNSDTGLKSLNYDGIIGVLVEAIKELSSRVKELENK